MSLSALQKPCHSPTSPGFPKPPSLGPGPPNSAQGSSGGRCWQLGGARGSCWEPPTPSPHPPEGPVAIAAEVPDAQVVSHQQHDVRPCCWGILRLARQPQQQAGEEVGRPHGPAEGEKEKHEKGVQEGAPQHASLASQTRATASLQPARPGPGRGHAHAHKATPTKEATPPRAKPRPQSTVWPLLPL